MNYILKNKSHIERIENLKDSISALNRLLLRVKDEERLFNEICNILVKNNNYIFVWVSLKGEDYSVKPVAQCGFESSYLKNIKIKWDNSKYADGPTGKAIKTGEPQVMQDIKNNPEFRPWRKEALKRGYRTSVAVPIKHGSNIIGALNVYSQYKNVFDDKELKFLTEVAADITLGVIKIRSEKKLKNIINGTIKAVSIIHKYRDPFTSEHQNNTAKLSVEIAKKLALPKNTTDGINISGLLHDIGKIAVPSSILNKPGKLNEHEYSIVKDHALRGFEILKNIDFSWPVAKATLQHHERLDGSGYPYGIKGDEIIIEAQILMVADVVEAMTSYRPYRPPLNLETALREISIDKGKLFNREAVDACIEIFKKDNFEFDNSFHLNDWIS